MNTLRVPGGTFIDALPNGRLACIRGNVIETHNGDIPLSDGDAPLYLRCGWSERFRFGGQSSGASGVEGLLEWIDGEGWVRDSSRIPTVRGVIYRKGQDEPLVWVGGSHLDSGGFRYVAPDGTPVMSDATHLRDGVSQWIDLSDEQDGSILVGQGNPGGGIVVLIDGVRRYVIQGPYYDINAKREGDQFAICGVRAEGQQTEAFACWPTLDELRALPPVDAAPDVQDTPPPPPVPTLRKPEVTVDRWTLDELKDGREIVFHDRENPALGYSSRVWVENGSLYASIANAAGTGRTGARRAIKPCGSSATEPQPNPEPIEPQPIGWRPSRDEVLNSLKADIAMTDVDGQDTEWGTWEALWWSDERFAAFAQRYHARGLSLVPCNLVVTNYRGVTFDFTQDLALAKARLERCYQQRLIPMLCLTMVDARGKGAETIAILERILPELRDYLVAVLTAWELEVDGGPSVYSPEEHARVIALADQHLPNVVIGVEFASPADRSDPIIYDGRAVGEGREAPDYWQRPEAQRVDVVMLEIPHGIVHDPKRVCMEVGGAVYRLQGAFDVPDRWPDGEPIGEDYRGNWRNDYGIHKRVMAFEYASFQRWSSDRKRALREFVEKVIPIAGFGEG